MSRWFRHYAGMMRDDKLVRVAIKCGQSIERVLWVWGAILESAAEIDDNGRFDVDESEIAYFLRADEDHIRAITAALADAGRLDSGAVAKWSHRQFSSDRSAARVAAYRERKRGGQREGNDKQASQDDGVTLQKRHRNAPETETDTYIPLSNDNGPADEPKATPEEIKKAIWRNGRELLEPAGYTPKQAGSVIGKWVKEHGEGPTMSAILRAKAIGPPEPLEFVHGIFRNEARKVKCEVPLI